MDLALNSLSRKKCKTNKEGIGSRQTQIGPKAE